jgi:hypothetical protein
MTENRYITKTLDSALDIHGQPETIWKNITNVQIETYSDPILFRLLDIPKPMRAEVISEGQGGKRIAWFKTGKRFVQEILVWKPLKEYAFSFHPEKGFRVLYFFDLSDGVFQILTGAYALTTTGQTTRLRLTTTYRIHKRFYFLFHLPVRIILKAFQRYLLMSIQKNSE